MTYIPKPLTNTPKEFNKDSYTPRARGSIQYSPRAKDRRTPYHTQSEMNYSVLTQGEEHEDMGDENAVDDAPSRSFLAVDGGEELCRLFDQPRDLELGPHLLEGEHGRRKGDDDGEGDGRTEEKDRSG